MEIDRSACRHRVRLKARNQKMYRAMSAFKPFFQETVDIEIGLLLEILLIILDRISEPSISKQEMEYRLELFNYLINLSCEKNRELIPLYKELFSTCPFLGVKDA